MIQLYVKTVALSKLVTKWSLFHYKNASVLRNLLITILMDKRDSHKIISIDISRPLITFNMYLDLKQ